MPRPSRRRQSSAYGRCLRLGAPRGSVLIDLSDGSACAEAWGCDLTYDYVKINGDYRT